MDDESIQMLTNFCHKKVDASLCSISLSVMSSFHILKKDSVTEFENLAYRKGVQSAFP